MRNLLLLWAVLFVAVPGHLVADGGLDDPVARDESLAIKNNLKAVLEALGAPPVGYAKAAENYDLPTSMGFDKAAGRFWLVEAHADFEFTSGMSGEQMAQEYQKKVMAAQAKGDYAEVQRLASELQQGMAAAMGAEMSKIKVTARLNNHAHQAIDPEGVVWETGGAIALRLEGGQPGNVRIMLAFDPKSLADTKTLSLISLGPSLTESAATKTAVRTVVVEIDGPQEAVTAWANGVDKGRILALIKG
ncbi:MAG: hypothetical protein IPK64_09610 [bacterium]|nr:hypothetical protein [bacterium]